MADIKGQILNLLRNQGDVVSGEVLSRELGLSRVSVWKHIQGLKEAGYVITAAAKGYRLIKSPDVPFDWEFSGWRGRIHYYQKASSTMNIAREMARQGCPEMTVVVTDVQTNGRGRMNRTWHSEKGGLYFTLILRPVATPQNSPRINLYAATILAEVLRRQYQVDAGVKWPNDILVNGKKVAGILSQMEAEFDQVSYLNIGLGINVNNDPTPYEPGAIALGQLLGQPVSRLDLLKSFLDAFETNYPTAALRQTVDRWKRLSVTLDRSVKVVTPRSVTEGVAVDVDANGGLIIQQFS